MNRSVQRGPFIPGDPGRSERVGGEGPEGFRRFAGEKILEGLEVIDKEVRTKKKTREQPIVDATDVSKLLFSLIFVLDCVGKPALNANNHQQVLVQ